MLFDFLLNVYLFALLLRRFETFLGVKRYAFYNEYVMLITNPLVKWFGKSNEKTGLSFALLFVFVIKCVLLMSITTNLLSINMIYSSIVFTAEKPVIRDCFFKGILTFVLFIFRLEFFLMISFMLLQNSLYGGFIGFLQSLVKPFTFIRQKIFRKKSEGVLFLDVLILFLLASSCFSLILILNQGRLELVNPKGAFSVGLIRLILLFVAIAIKDLSVFIWFILIKALLSWTGATYTNSGFYFLVEVGTAILKPFYRFNLHIGLFDFTPIAVLFAFYLMQNFLLHFFFVVYMSF